MDYYYQRLGVGAPTRDSESRHSHINAATSDSHARAQREQRVATANLYRLQQGMIKGHGGARAPAEVQYRCERCGI